MTRFAPPAGPNMTAFTDVCPTITQRGSVMVLTFETHGQPFELAMPIHTFNCLAECSRRAMVDVHRAMVVPFAAKKRKRPASAKQVAASGDLSG